MAQIDGLDTIHGMNRLPGLNPSALVALHALLQARHVTRAAQRLGITQSSMSHRLQQLRKELKDPLLVPLKGMLVLTPRATAMEAPLAAALHALRVAVEPPATFDPATSRHTISLAMPDLLAPLLPGLLTALTTEAPNVNLQVLNLPPALSDSLSTGAPAIALAGVNDAQPSTVVRRLGEVRFGIAARRGHPLLQGKLTVERWLSYGHVVVRLGTETVNRVSIEIAKKGLTRRVGAEVPTFLAGLFLVAGSDLLMNAPLPLVLEVADTLELEVREAPLALPRLSAALLWHKRFQADPTHRWARERIYAAVRQRLK